MAKVLIVDDNAALREVYATLLSKEGYEVDVATQGQEALDKAEKNPPDLILLDILMPTLDGVAFLKAFDLKNRHPGVKVVVFSNSEEQGKMQEAAALGAVRYVTKYNITPKAMVQLVKDVLAEKS